jgi:hypothetical protein
LAQNERQTGGHAWQQQQNQLELKTIVKGSKIEKGPNLLVSRILTTTERLPIKIERLLGTTA